jgi:hypothetical protein
MSASRDELRELVERLPNADVPAVMAEVRRYPAPASRRPSPPRFFGAARVGRSDVDARSEEILDQGFGRPA